MYLSLYLSLSLYIYIYRSIIIHIHCRMSPGVKPWGGGLLGGFSSADCRSPTGALPTRDAPVNHHGARGETLTFCSFPPIPSVGRPSRVSKAPLSSTSKPVCS